MFRVLPGALLQLMLAALLLPSWAAANDVWPRPELAPIPAPTRNVAHPVLNLDGVWKFSFLPPPEFWTNGIDTASWTDVKVPGELLPQGFALSRNVEYPYKKLVPIPAEFRGQRVILRFDGVYSYARVWVNGKFVRDHHGGFTSWQCDITDLVTPGESAWITVGVTDFADDISDESEYAKHLIAGILSDVRLVALPPDHLTRLQAETDFATDFLHAQLKVTAAMSFRDAQRATVKLRLRDPQDSLVPLSFDALQLSTGRPESTVSIPVKAPQKWDAEHPHLYTLEVSLLVNGNEVETLTKKIGFRRIEWVGNRLMVNHQDVKLRGVCRHNAHPLRGRSSDPALDEKDVILFRNANVNFVRTSHYPPTEAFLEACDRYGMYVEEETAIAFQLEMGSPAHPAPSDDPKFTARFMEQFAEMVERDRSHASVLMWSLGNESTWGENFAKEYAYAKQEDRTRPVIFSFPNTVPRRTDGYDILSMHYPRFDDDLSSADVPKLNDEYVHAACYNVDTLRRDPGVRNFWGERMKATWDNCLHSEGCLGGAIWGAIDDVFFLTDDPVGYGEWGIIDGWRRPKPEYWLTQKAYSPIRIPDEPLANPGPGNPLAIPVWNEFDHTDLSEVTTLWNVGAENGKITNLREPPHSFLAPTMLTIPARAWRLGDVVHLRFYRAGDILVDEYKLPVGKPVKTFPHGTMPAPKVTESAASITVAGPDFELVFSRATGLITRGVYRGISVIEGGPNLNLGALKLAPWWLNRMSWSTTADEAVIKLEGQYSELRGSDMNLSTTFEIRIDGNGLVTTDYQFSPGRWGSPPSGVTEVGVSYVLPATVAKLTWNKQGLWSVYPDDHIGRLSGETPRTRGGEVEAYGAEPAWPWSSDMTNYFLYGRSDPGPRETPDFRSLKDHIWFASCVLANTEIRVRAESDGTAAARAEVRPDGKVMFHINNIWGYVDLDFGSHPKPLVLPHAVSNRVQMRLTDNDRCETHFADVSTGR